MMRVIMLNEIINKVAEKVGISVEKATSAVNIVVDVLKEKLPGPISSHLDSILSGKGVTDMMDKGKDAASGLFDSAKDKIGSLFGKK